MVKHNMRQSKNPEDYMKGSTAWISFFTDLILRSIHFSSDVIGGMIFGIFAGVIGYLAATKWLPAILAKRSGASS